MTVAEIPADQVIEMTEVLHRAFKAGGCAPVCHCCCKQLVPSTQFHLATVATYQHPRIKNDEGHYTANSGISRWATEQTREVMLCAECDVAKMNAMTAEQRQRYEDYRAQGGGCHRVNGQIVH